MRLATTRVAMKHAVAMVGASAVLSAAIATQTLPHTASTHKTPTFVHLTDVHYDQYYEQLSDERTMCHAGSGVAGHFGTEGSMCDSPQTLIQQAFGAITAADPDFLLYTGDSTRHDRDPDLPRDASELVSQLAFVSGKLAALYTQHGTRVFPAIGNWDVFPKDLLAANDSQALTSILTSWAPLIADIPGAEDSFRAAGYYAADSADPRLPNVGVIALNTLWWYNLNVLVDDCSIELPTITITNKTNVTTMENDIPHLPDRQLVFLQNKLQSAAESNRKYLLIGHIPPISVENEGLYKPNCLAHFIRILGSNSNAVSAGYFGHTNIDAAYIVYKPKNKAKTTKANFTMDHQTQLESNERLQHVLGNDDSFVASNNDNVTYNITAVAEKFLAPGTEILESIDSNNQANPLAVLYSSASLTPVHAPAFRIAKLSPVTQYVEDHHQMYANLAEATNTLGFVRGCGLRRFLGLKSGSPSGWRGLLRRLRRGNAPHFFARYNECLTVEDAAQHTDRLYLSRRVVNAILACTTFVFVGLVVLLHVISARRDVLKGDLFTQQQHLFDARRIPKQYGGTRG